MKIQLRSQYPAKQIGFPGGAIELSWQVSGANRGEVQSAYEIAQCLVGSEMCIRDRHLPTTVWNRPKHGFSVPLRNLFNGAWENVAKQYISQSQKIAPFLDQRQLNLRWNMINRNGQSKRLMYSFLVLLIWMEKNKVDF